MKLWKYLEVSSFKHLVSYYRKHCNLVSEFKWPRRFEFEVIFEFYGFGVKLVCGGQSLDIVQFSDECLVLRWGSYLPTWFIYSHPYNPMLSKPTKIHTSSHSTFWRWVAANNNTSNSPSGCQCIHFSTSMPQSWMNCLDDLLNWHLLPLSLFISHLSINYWNISYINELKDDQAIKIEVKILFTFEINYFSFSIKFTTWYMNKRTNFYVICFVLIIVVQHGQEL